MDFHAILEFMTGIGAVLGSLGLSGGAVWALFRKRIREWGAPYQGGLKGAAQVPELKRDVEQMAGAMHLLTLHVRAKSDIDIEQAQFETNADGANTYVNLTYARWLGVGKAELLGWGWINFVHEEDRIYVRQEWDSARREHRKYNVRFRFIDAGGEEFQVDVLATPIPDAPPAKQWLGVIRRIAE